MANHHLRNKALSLKAKGLLSLMLSLPEDWDYTTRGLSCICKDGVDSIRVGIQELEANGYLVRERRRNENGQYGAIEYTILEKPRQAAIPPPVQEKPVLENPTQVIPMQVLPTQEIPAQLSIEESNTQKSNTDKSNTHSFFPSDAPTEGQTEIRDVRERIKHLRQEHDGVCGQRTGNHGSPHHCPHGAGQGTGKEIQSGRAFAGASDSGYGRCCGMAFL